MPMSNHELVLTLFLQLGVILAVCRLAGHLGRRLGQTQVVSEMVAGVLLGPSLFGWILPEAQRWLFPITLVIPHAGASLVIPHPSMTILYAISQVGLVLYMFLVGLEFDAQLMFHPHGLAAIRADLRPAPAGGREREGRLSGPPVPGVGPGPSRQPVRIRRGCAIGSGLGRR
jgi:hypothetical protein